VTPFEVVAEPARRELLDALVPGPKPVGELSAVTGLSQPNTSRHLRILREAGIVRCRPDGRRRLYELRPERLLELDRWLTPYRELWRSSLGALERNLDEGNRLASHTRRDPR
jgi:DNA-binding transcriptional ArsR family regulator